MTEDYAKFSLPGRRDSIGGLLVLIPRGELRLIFV